MPKQDVKYEVVELDELPERAYGTSDLEQHLQDAMARPQGKPYSIASYDNRTAASAAANNLRRRHGQPEASGLKFECHRLPTKNADGTLTGESRSHLIVVRNDSWITDEGVAAFSAWRDADKKLKAEQARIRKAAKAEAKAAEANAKPAGAQKGETAKR